jgi:hypothetical protein
VILDPTDGHVTAAARLGASTGTVAGGGAWVGGNLCFGGLQVHPDFGSASNAGYVACVDAATLGLTWADSWAQLEIAVLSTDDGQLYAMGRNLGTTAALFGGTALAPNDAFVAGWSTSTTPLWSRNLGGPVDSWHGTVSHGVLLASITTSSMVDWGSGTLPSPFVLGAFDL